MTLEGFLFGLENAVIATGYVWACIFLMPVLPVRRMTEWFGRAFFLLCAGTHLDHAVHAITRTDVATHEHLIHAPQAVAIWVFLLYFRADVVTLLDGMVAKSLQKRP